MSCPRQAGHGGEEQQVFKLLVTCQGHALEVSRFFAGHTMDIEEDIDGDDTAEWTMSTMTY